MNDKYLSVITNFGCHYSCQYCIVKNNHLNIPKTTIHGLNNLFSEIVKNRCNWVSLSGGGDPLWKYEQHKDWYEKFFEIVDAAHVNTELHTSLHAVQGVSYNHFDRVVYHLHSLEQLYSIKRENCFTAKIMFIRNIKILGVIVMVKVRDILPLIQWNDAQIIKDQDEEICLLRNDFIVGSLSEEILNMTVTGIENDENIENTVVVYVTDEED